MIERDQRQGHTEKLPDQKRRQRVGSEVENKTGVEDRWRIKQSRKGEGELPVCEVEGKSLKWRKVKFYQRTRKT